MPQPSAASRRPILVTFLALAATGLNAQDPTAPFELHTNAREVIDFLWAPAALEVEPSEVGAEPEVARLFVEGDALHLGEGSLPEGLWLHGAGSPAEFLSALPDQGLGFVWLGVLRGMFTMTLVGEGVRGKTALEFFEQLRTFPTQIQNLEVEGRTIAGLNETEGVDIHARLVPRPGTWLHRLHHACAPVPTGAPALPLADGGSGIAVAMPAPALAIVMEPLHEYHLARLRRLPDQEGLRECLALSARALNGALALAVDHNTGTWTQLLGVGDADVLAASRSHPSLAYFQQRVQSDIELLPMREIPDVPVRDVDVARTLWSPRVHGIAALPATVNPNLVVYSGTVGGFEATMEFDRDDDPQALARAVTCLERARDRQLPIGPLPDLALADLDLNVEVLTELLDEAAVLPAVLGWTNFDVRRARITIAKDGDGFTVRALLFQ